MDPRLRGAQPRAAARGRGRARPGLHPRGRGLGEDDDDHAARGEPGRHGRLRARRDPRGHVHGQGRHGDARAARRASAPRASRRARSTPPRWRSSATSAARSSARCSRRRRRSCCQIARALPARTASAPLADLATEIEWAKNRPAHAGDVPPRARRPRAADPRRPDGARLPHLRGAQGRARPRRLRGPAELGDPPVRRGRRGAGDVPRALPRVHGRRVPGRQPAPADPASTAGSATATSSASSATTTSRSTPSRARRPSTCSGCRGGSPGAPVVRLEENYRSTPEILAVANRLVPELGGSEKVLRAVRSRRPEPVVDAPVARPPRRAESLVAPGRRLAGEGVPYEEMAVLYRLNARSEDYEEAFAPAGIPYQVRGAAFLRRRPPSEDPAAPCEAGRRVVRPARSRSRATRRADANPARQGSARRSRRARPTSPGSSRSRTSSTTARTVADFLRRPGDALRRREQPRRRPPAHLPPRQGARVGGRLPPPPGGEGAPVRKRADDRLAEERRLFYVGMTRAKRSLSSPGGGGAEPLPGGARRARHGEPGPRLVDEPLFAALKPHGGSERAQADGVPAYVVFHDQTLQEIAAIRSGELQRCRRSPVWGRRSSSATATTS